MRPAVLNTLQNLGAVAAPAISALVHFLTNSDDIIERGLAADVLAAIGPPGGEAVSSLAKCLEEPGDGTAKTFFRLKVARAAQTSVAQRAALGNKQKHEAVRRRRYTPQPRVDAFRGAPWVTDDNTHGYPAGVLQEAAITMTPPSRLVKRLRRIGWMGTGNPGCAAKRVDPGLRDNATNDVEKGRWIPDRLPSRCAAQSGK